MLLQLLKSCPFDLSPRGASPEIVNFLGSALRGMAGAVEWKLSTALVTALNVVLLRGGLDLSPALLAALHQNMQPFIEHALGGGGGGAGGGVDGGGGGRGGAGGVGAGAHKRGGHGVATDRRLSEAVVTYCRLQLSLGGLQACPGALQHLAWVLEDVVPLRAADAATISASNGSGGGGGGGGGEYVLKHAHAALCALAADVFVAQCRGTEGAMWALTGDDASASIELDMHGDGDDDSDGDGIMARAANKRRRTMTEGPGTAAGSGAGAGAAGARRPEAASVPPLARLGSLVTGAGTAAWAPVMCLVLARHGAALPRALTTSWLHDLAAALSGRAWQILLVTSYHAI